MCNHFSEPELSEDQVVLSLFSTSLLYTSATVLLELGTGGGCSLDGSHAAIGLSTGTGITSLATSYLFRLITLALLCFLVDDDSKYCSPS